MKTSHLARRFAVLVVLCGCEAASESQQQAGTDPNAGGVFRPAEVEAPQPTDPSESTVTVSARFVNLGSVPLTIHQIQISCACTMAGDLPKSPLSPNEEVVIPLSVSPPPHGTTIVDVSAVTDPPSRDAKLRIIARGLQTDPPFFDEIPPVINVAHTAGKPFRAVARFICVENAGEVPWVQEVHVDHSGNAPLEATLMPLPGPTPYPFTNGIRRSYEAVVQCSDSSAAIPPFRLQLMTRSDRFQDPPQSIRFQVRNVPLVRLVPEVIRWDTSSDDQGRSRSVILAFGSSAEWTVTVDTLPPWLSVKLATPPNEKYSQLLAEIVLGDGGDDLQEFVVTFHCTAPDHGTITCRLPLQFVQL
jgi:hypothetical protein